MLHVLKESARILIAAPEADQVAAALDELEPARRRRLFDHANHPDFAADNVTDFRNAFKKGSMLVFHCIMAPEPSALRAGTDGDPVYVALTSQLQDQFSPEDALGDKLYDLTVEELCEMMVLPAPSRKRKLIGACPASLTS